MYGLTSIARSTKGLPIKKPWTIAIDCPTMAKYLQKKCYTFRHKDRTTGAMIPHASCSGVNTKVTEGYTDEFATAVHNGHRDYVYGTPLVAHSMSFPAKN